jgi:hypothetical protein
MPSVGQKACPPSCSLYPLTRGSNKPVALEPEDHGRQCRRWGGANRSMPPDLLKDTDAILDRSSVASTRVVDAL